MSSPHTPDLTLALQTVHRATLLTKRILASRHNSVSALSKADASPVTIADFAAQCLIISAIRSVHPTDAFVGEENADALRKDQGLREAVWELVRTAGGEGESVRGGGRLATPKTVDEMLDVIDVGVGTQTRTGRVWVLDPVDGTATFMKGQQYAVCLALLVDGLQTVGVVAAPNLAWSSGHGTEARRIHEERVDREGWGVVLSAVVGEGAFVRKIEEEGFGKAERLGVEVEGNQEKEFSELEFVDAALGSTTLWLEKHRDIAEGLGAKWPGTILWSQQMKYVALALGAVDVMLRIPKTKDRFTQVWDHAGGQLIFQEAGGIIRDLDGGVIDFAQGRKIEGERNFGMVAASPWCWEKVETAVRAAMESEKA
jgi:3'(2'), 5'-bisphosphate nucleotidase